MVNGTGSYAPLGSGWFFLVSVANCSKSKKIKYKKLMKQRLFWPKADDDEKVVNVSLLINFTEAFYCFFLSGTFSLIIWQSVHFNK